ncbi:MAG TPA: cytochrome C biosynthesis protein [Bacteroidales bacterium]|nr:cytochrome C biosynthesis protein [Bacteroidales bacterium]HBZ20191.1 cytochrome C biosynthesis protein [Bacteroidales bacterium]
MIQVKKIYIALIFLSGLFLLTCCNKESGMDIVDTNRKPQIKPNYIDVTIPPNIAPMNFRITETGEYFRVTVTSGSTGSRLDITSKDGLIQFPEKTWRKLVENSRGGKITFEVFSAKKESKSLEQYEPFFMYVPNEPVDPYLAYRLIYPGYYNWSHIKIMQRSTESFREDVLVDNQILDMNCINCHSFNNYNPEKFMVHIRGSHGGTYFAENGKITKREPRVDAMPGGATYPSWHPGGRFIAYSSNQVRQGFYSRPEKIIEVFDLVSSIICFDIEKNEIINVRNRDTTKYLETFPSWSPDGKFLYFCRALQANSLDNMTLEEIRKTNYDIVRIPFDSETVTFGNTEVVFKASESGKSASFPRISPDGKYLVFTLHDFGTFPIWHQEADLYLLDLQNGACKKMDLNSNQTESYHTWSSNGKWLVFSSKRTDGRSTRPFIAYFESWDKTGKPFILPQKDPSYYDELMESFNIPEFVTGRIKYGPRDFAKVSRDESIKAKPRDPLESLSKRDQEKANVKRNPGERSIHE